MRTLARAEAASAPEAWLRALPPACRPVLLHGSAGGPSLLAWNPDRVREETLAPAPQPGQRWPLAARDPARVLEADWAQESWEGAEGGLGPAWIGWFGWACAHAAERWPWLPPARPQFPDWSFARYLTAVRFQGDGGAELLHAGSASDEAAARDAFTQICAAAHAVGPASAEAPDLAPREDGSRFRASVARLREWIGNGELYQANLSHPLEAAWSGDPRALYAAVARRQPTRSSAYWEDGSGRALLSHSPELFLGVRGERLETRPIKGTSPRHADPAQDAASACALESSEKERAELAMIVDVARNDLGRVAVPASVEVISAGEVEAYPTLFHRTASVRARWEPRLGFARLWTAVFPPASVSGAPKVRALQSIAELEGEDRGPYCGALGWWRPTARPEGEFSVMIRTAVADGTRLTLRVGAGIVWDSQPEREWTETLLKGRYLSTSQDVRAS